MENHKDLVVLSSYDVVMTLNVSMLKMFVEKCLWKQTNHFNEPVPSKDNLLMLYAVVIYTCTDNNTRLDLLRTTFFVKSLVKVLYLKICFHEFEVIILLLPSLDVVEVPPEPRPAGGRAGGHSGARGS